MKSNFLVGVEALRPICVGWEVGSDPEYMWIATHKDYDWFCGLAKTSQGALIHLETLVASVEKLAELADEESK